MGLNSLEQKLDKQWQKVKSSFYYPQLPKPKLDSSVDNGVFDFSNMQISISPKYLEYLEESGVSKDTSMNAILAHEVGHFVDYPGSVLDLLRLQSVARKKLPRGKAYMIRELFLNIQNNTNLVQNRGYESIPEALKPEALKTEGINKVLFGLQQELWDRDLGLNMNWREKKIVNELIKLDYLNKYDQEYNLKKFIGILEKHFPRLNEKELYILVMGGRIKGQGSSRGNGAGGKIAIVSSLDAFSDDQIKEGMRQFAQESDPKEFEDLMKDILEELNKRYGGDDWQLYPMGGAGTGEGNPIIANNFYSALSENFLVPIKHKQMKANGNLYPHSHKGFSMDDDIDELDVFSSPGVIPGVTKKWIKKQGSCIEDKLGVPNSLIVIDSSGSMPDPSKSTSLPVLAATVIANSYLNNDSLVTVYNFSGTNMIVGPSNDKEKIHKIIRTYQRGGTVFDSEVIEEIIKAQGSVDLSVISDMDIHNVANFVNCMSELPNIHRIHLIYNTNEYVQYVYQNLKSKDNIALLPLYVQKDINEIIMGELKKSIR